MNRSFPVIDRPSPNFDGRPHGVTPDMLVLHYTGMPTGQAALERLCDPAAKVSAHYMIEEDGTIFRLVAEEMRAWHAGVSFWQGQTDINGCSIGIELVNPGHEWGYRQFPDTQIERLIELARDVLGRHQIPPQRSLGQSAVAPGRRQDPGELVPWATLARAGVGLWPCEQANIAAEPTGAAHRPDGLKTFFEELSVFGYGIESSGRYRSGATEAVTAFQRHWRPDKIDGVPDDETRMVLNSLISQTMSPGAKPEP